MLRIEGLTAGYGGIEVLHGLSLEINAGEIVALIGANGAGKTSTLRAISGVIRQSRGTITFDGRVLRREKPEDRAAMGIGHVPEGRGILASLTVRENLELGLVARSDRSRRAVARDLDRMMDIFPALAGRLPELASGLSGGQQQMLAIARALVAMPRLLMVDELSFGLAPILVDELFAVLRDLRAGGSTLLLVEQSAKVLTLSDRSYVLRMGRVVLEGPSSEINRSDELVSSYLGQQ